MGTQQAFVLRIKPVHNKIDYALNKNVIIIGWAMEKMLTMEWAGFRQTFSDEMYPENNRAAGQAAGKVWKFLHEMKKGDLVVVPIPGNFYVAQIIADKVAFELGDGDKLVDTFQREVKWLNNKQPIPRNHAKAGLHKRMKIMGTLARATDCLQDINSIVERLKNPETPETSKLPDFLEEAQTKMAKQFLDEIRNGHMQDRKFEDFIRALLVGIGCKDVRVVPKKYDKGVDVVGDLIISTPLFETSKSVAVQAKWWVPGHQVGVGVVNKLVEGMEHAGADLGMVITTGEISKEAREHAEELTEKTEKEIFCLDGEELATLIIEQGLDICSK